MRPIECLSKVLYTTWYIGTGNRYRCKKLLAALSYVRAESTLLVVKGIKLRPVELVLLINSIYWYIPVPGTWKARIHALRTYIINSAFIVQSTRMRQQQNTLKIYIVIVIQSIFCCGILKQWYPDMIVVVNVRVCIPGIRVYVSP